MKNTNINQGSPGSNGRQKPTPKMKTKGIQKKQGTKNPGTNKQTRADTDTRKLTRQGHEHTQAGRARTQNDLTRDQGTTEAKYMR